MEMLKSERYLITDSSIDTIPGMIIGTGDTKEEAIDSFLTQAKQAQKMCYKNIEMLDSLIRKANQLVK